MSFPHLHNHSDGSLLDGMCNIKEMVDWANLNKAPAIALTDHGNMFNVYDFYTQAKEANVKPIIGCEVYVAPEFDGMKSREKNQPSPYHLTLLCENEKGYMNLMQLVSYGYLQGFYRKPRIDLRLLGSYGEGLICLSGCVQSQLSRAITEQQDDADQVLKHLYDAIPEGNLYVEIQNHWIDEELNAYPKLCQLAAKYDLPVVATNDCHYLSKDDHWIHDIMLCIQMQQWVSNTDRMKFDNHFYFKTLQEMEYALEGYPKEAIPNAFEVAERCNVELTKLSDANPKYPDLPAGQTEYTYLKSLCVEGLTEKYGEEGMTDAMRHRLDLELSVIDQMGYCGYFLLVWDYAKYARGRGYPLGARGSGGGCLVLHAINVIDFNPMDYGCLFERFLNPDRVSMPDIDIDFGDEIRQDVIDYVRQKYGEGRVAHVATFSKLSPKSIVNDAGRALEIPIPVTRSLSKELDHPKDPMKAMKQKIQQVGPKDPKLLRLPELCDGLNGIKRHASCHASAMIISDQHLINKVPLFTDRAGQVMTQFDGDTLEKLGLVKFDFLGSKALMQAHKCVEIVREKYDADITLSTIPLDCEKTYDLVGEGLLEGLFQLEASSGISRTTTDIAPRNFSEFLTITALYRPGPLNSGMTQQYINRKKGLQPVEYFHPILEDVLKETYGICIYQEQVMQIAQILAGFTPSEADVLRAGMSKADKDISEHRSKFVAGAVANEKIGYSESDANYVFDQLESFGGYGFNKSHTVAYSLLSYRMAYLKTHYPREFMSCVMTREQDNDDKMNRYVQECRRLEQYLGVEITMYPPHVNKSSWEFHAEENGIRLGLCCIKHVSESIGKEIVDQRNLEGEYKSVSELCRRIPNKMASKKTVESLIQSGAVDGFEGHRAQLIHNLEDMLNGSKKSRENHEMGQISLFEAADIEPAGGSLELEECEKWTEAKERHNQKEVIGFNTGKHPMSDHKKTLLNYTTNTIENVLDCDEDEHVMIAGVVGDLKEKKTRTGNPLVVFRIEASTDSLECVLFAAKSGKKQVPTPEEGSIVIVRGNIKDSSDWNGDQYQLIVRSIISLENVGNLTTDVEITIPAEYNNNLPVLGTLKTICVDNPGDFNVFLRMESDENGKVLIECDKKYKVSGGVEFLEKVQGLIGEDCVQLTNKSFRMNLTGG